MNGEEVDGAVRLSVLAMDVACQADPADIGNRVTELAAKLVSCTAVDIVAVARDGELQIPASSDRALSAVTKLVWRRWPRPSNVSPGIAELDVAKRDPGYAQQMREYCQISGERYFELKVSAISYGYLRFLFRDADFRSPADEELARAFAAHAAIALDRAALLIKIGNLQAAIDTNREIGAAVGILMAKHTISYDEGFSLLLRISQNDNRKLRDVAADVVYTGTLPRQRHGRSPLPGELQPSPAPVRRRN